MRRILVAALATALGAGIGFAVLDAAVSDVPAASALSPGDITGRYNVKFKGDGWVARAPAKSAGGSGYRHERVGGGGRLEIVSRDAGVNDGLVTVRIYLDEAAKRSLLGQAVPPPPAFEATAAIVGQSISVIASGQPNFVNALTLRFTGAARNVTGTWMAVFPALERTQSFATGVTVTINGRRARRDAVATPRR